MKYIIFVIALAFSWAPSQCQNDFVQVETNKVLCLFSFIETAANKNATSYAFRDWIAEQTEGDRAFASLVARYDELQLRYTHSREEYPFNRHNYFDSKDLLWVAASYSNDLHDFSERITGYLPHEKHHELIDILRNITPFYDDLVWNKKQDHIKRIEKQLSGYTNEIGKLYRAISNFYNANWHPSAPFKISLYPIPLAQGHTTAIPKGNALICGFLTDDEKDYEGRMGVIMHEMCHILYATQSSIFQQEVDGWFEASNSPYAKLAYTYINEGLATALGNGWAYEQIHGVLDTLPWYDDDYIDGYAHALFPMTKKYIEQGKSMDKTFVDDAIDLFGETFPKTNTSTSLLMNAVRIFSNTEAEDGIQLVSGLPRKYFNIQSMWLSTPISAPQSIDGLKEKRITKLLVIESNHTESIKKLNEIFPDLNIDTPLNALEVFYDEESKSNVVIMSIDGLDDYENGIQTLSGLTYLENGKRYLIQ